MEGEQDVDDVARTMNKQAQASVGLCMAAASLVLFASGCGGSSPYPMTKVSGKVLYEDGESIPAETIAIRFDSLESALDAKTHPRPGMAATGPEGAFEVVTTSDYADGIITGKHKVQISATDAQGKNLIPPEYGNYETTPIEVNSADSPFEFRVPRP